LFPNKETYHEGHSVTELLQGWCIVIKRTALYKIMPLDEQFDMYYQDNDLAECLKEKGIKHALVKKAKADHQQTHTIGLPYSEEKIKKSAEDEQKFRTKWNIWT
jgi:GT2 family glycosyltransferase